MADIELMTPEEVCRVLAISKPTLWRLKKTSQLVPLYVLSSPRYSKASVTRFIEKAQKAAISQALIREAKLGQG